MYLSSRNQLGHKTCWVAHYVREYADIYWKRVSSRVLQGLWSKLLNNPQLHQIADRGQFHKRPISRRMQQEDLVHAQLCMTLPILVIIYVPPHYTLPLPCTTASALTEDLSFASIGAPAGMSREIISTQPLSAAKWRGVHKWSFLRGS